MPRRHKPEAVGIGPDGVLTLSEWAILAALINATKDQQSVLDFLLGIGTSTASTTERIGLLGQAAPDSLWSKLVSFFEGFVDGVLTVVGLRTEQLCVGGTCVNEEQLLQLLEHAGVAPAVRTSSPESDAPPENTPDTSSGAGADNEVTDASADTGSTTPLATDLTGDDTATGSNATSSGPVSDPVEADLPATSTDPVASADGDSTGTTTPPILEPAGNDSGGEVVTGSEPVPASEDQDSPVVVEPPLATTTTGG